jgi:hypothetical protein
VTSDQPDRVRAVHLDGPLAGQLGHAANRLGSRSTFVSAADGRTGVYEVTRPATDGRPAELRFAGYTG